MARRCKRFKSEKGAKDLPCSLLLRLLQARHAAGDGGDQSFWRRYFNQVHELPAVYNAEKRNNISNWRSVFVLHDLWGPRWARWWPLRVKEHDPGSVPLLQEYDHLTINASRLMASALGERNGPINHTRIVCYRKNVMQLCDEDPYWRPAPGPSG